ncbi:coenzyme F420-0:L-glutamate ligase [Candidatus Kaiserbacteria bacterium]|nr:coenzyme F420-0:L-glutamate ligase [Candidatus Kaiserbacteria bacterium]
MQYIPIKTRVLNPPQDDLFGVLNGALNDLKEGDVLLVTSKVVSIHQGRCVPQAEVNKRDLVEQEADYLIEGYERFRLSPLAIKHNALFSGAGIDESNADGHYILLPSKPFDEAERIWEFVTGKHGFKNLGVVITDSHSQPMRSGAVGVAIAWWGFHPTESHTGRKDLFDRPLQWSATNIVDCIAAGGGAVSGEADESTPFIIVRNVPNLEFTKVDTRHEVFRAPKEDIFYPLLKPFYDN